MSEIRLHLGDCMTAMAKMPDQAYSLAIVDPPYFSGPEKRKYYGQANSSIGVKRINYPVTCSWAVPDAEYFEELTRVSEHQIIWGWNYYHQILPSTGRIIWDKVNSDSSFSDCEIAYCSLHGSVRQFRYMWNGMLQGKSIGEGHIMNGNKSTNEKRIHTTQKPVALYKWLLSKYPQPGDKILDTHGGSRSLAIACHDMGFEHDSWEIDPIYHAASVRRLEQHQKQLQLFQP